MLPKLIFLIFVWFFAASIASSSDISLWDHVVKMEQVILSVEYKGRHLNVWKDSTQGYNRFYVTPLCVLDTTSITCTRDEYSDEHRHIFRFYLKLWDSSVAQTIQLALKQKGIEVKASDILPLPMQMTRLGLSPDVTSQIYASHHWRSHQDQPNTLMLELYTRHENFCNKMISDATNNLQIFLANTKINFEFSMVVQQRATRNLNITGTTIAKSSVFSNLVNHYSNPNGMVYLTSKDLNTLARSILRVVAVEEEVTSNYIPSEQENQIIHELLGIIEEQKIQSNDLTKDEWNSVFWNDIFSRPDIQSEYSNEVLKFDETQNQFKYNVTKDREFKEKLESRTNKQTQKGKSSGFGFSWGGFGLNLRGNRNKNVAENGEEISDKENHEHDTLSFDDIQKILKKEHVNVHWSGTKFEPKPFSLHRINTKTLKNCDEIFYKRIVTTKMPSTQKIEIRPDLLYTPESKKTIGYLTYEAIMEKLEKYKTEQKVWNDFIENHKTAINNLQTANNEIQIFKNDQKTVWNGHVQNLITWINNLQNDYNAVKNDYNAFKNDQKTVWNVHVQNLITWINNLQNDYNGVKKDYKIKLYHLIECQHAMGQCVHLPKIQL